MAITVNSHEWFNWGNRQGVIADIAFDSSYPTGGEAFDVGTLFGMQLGNVEAVFAEPKSGYAFVYDKTNEKLLAYRYGGANGTMGGSTAAGAAHTHTFTGTAEKPVIRVEDTISVVANIATLTNIPLYIIAVHVTAGDVTGAFSVIPVGETPATKQVAVNFTTGGMTFLGTDAVTAVKVTYLPIRSSGYLAAVTVDEVVTAAAAKANLAARAGLIQYVWDDTDSTLCSFEQPGTAPSATHFCTVDINDGGNSSIESHADDESNSLKVTYVPYTAIPAGCFIDDTDITLSSEAWNFTGDPGVAGYNHTIVPGFGVNIIGETGAAARSAAVWEGPSGTAANGVATWNPATNALLTNQDTAMTIASMPWMILDTNQLTPYTPAGTNGNESTHTHAATGLSCSVAAAALSEVSNTTDLSALTSVKIFVISQ